MTNDEKELLKIGAEASLKPFSALIESLFGGASRQLGGILEDGTKVRRIARQIKLLEKLDRMLQTSGCAPSQIPDKIWQPIWNFASLEDDDWLRDRWASLLANAATPNIGNDVHPSFSGILKDLTNVEARFLDRIFDRACARHFDKFGDSRISPNSIQGVLFDQDDLRDAYDAVDLVHNVPIAHLTHEAEQRDAISAKISESGIVLRTCFRLGLMDRILQTKTNPFRGSVPERPQQMETLFFLTGLGYEFVTACRFPPSAD